MKLIKVIPLVLLAQLLFAQLTNAQMRNCVKASANPTWTSNPFEHFIFVENIGQFDDYFIENINANAWGTNPNNKMRKLDENVIKKNKILYYANSKGVDIYFSANGLLYNRDEYRSLVSEKEREKIEMDGIEKSQNEVEVKHHILQLEWVGANSDVAIEGNDVQSYYYTYPNKKDNGKTSLKASCFKKITYKNLYPFIDVEYILPDKGGIKYSIILRPGADLSSVKMLYKNAKQSLSAEQGNIIIKSAFGDFVDHAPISFYTLAGTSHEGENIPSAFELRGDTVSFSLHSSNTQQQTIIIDPWTTNPAFPVNKSYDVNYDAAGNVYVCGSGSPAQPYKLAKFNNAGILQWVFNTNLGAAVGGTAYGDFAVDEITGTTYLMGTWPYIVKVNSLGVQTNQSTSALFPLGLELWRCEYNRCLKKIVIGCGSVLPNVQTAMLDTSLTTFTAINSFAAFEPLHDVTLLATDPNSSFCYAATAKSTLNSANLDNVMIKMPIPALTPSTWGPLNDGHTFGEIKSVKYTPLPPGINGYSNGFNGMACSPDFLYTYDGSVLKKWNKNTGAFLSQINTGGTMFATGGLTADKCNNVYAGAGNIVKKYDSSLNQIATYNVPDSCYDLKLGPNNKLYACGLTFVAQFDVPALAPPTAISTPASGCNVCDGTATAIPCGNPAGYTYLWSAGGQTTQTSTGLCQGTYTVSISYSCTDIDIVTVSVAGNSGGNINISTSSFHVSCSLSNGTVSVLPGGGVSPYTYNWSNGQTTPTATGLIHGNYTVTVTDQNGCSNSTTLNIAASAALNVNATSTPSSCGGANGSANVTASGGTVPYTYIWSNGQTTQTATGLIQGNYTVTVTDQNGCSNSTTLNITAPAVLGITASSTPLNCGAANGSANVTVTGGTIPYTYIWSNGQTTQIATGLIQGNYTVTVTDQNGCSNSTALNITAPAVLNVIASSIPSSCGAANGSANVTASGGTGSYTYIWSNGSTNQTNTGLTAMIYTVTVTDANGCSSTASTNLVNTGGGLAAINILSNVNCHGGVTGSAIASMSGGSPAYTYSWSNGATTQTATNLTQGIYTVTITESGGCSATSTTTITEPNQIICLMSTTDEACGLINGKATATVSGGTGPLTYTWSNSQTTQAAIGLSAGTYTLTITDSNGCAATTVATVFDINPAFISVTPAQQIINVGGTVSILVTGANTNIYTWSPAEGLSCTNCANLLATPVKTTTYTVTATDLNGCTFSAMINIIVKPLCVDNVPDLFIANVFSPNNDGKNDVLYIEGSGLTNIYWAIYDRWGNLLFETFDQNHGWDGTKRGLSMDSGTYVYYLKANCLTTNAEVKMKGNVSIVK